MKVELSKLKITKVRVKVDQIDLLIVDNVFQSCENNIEI